MRRIVMFNRVTPNGYFAGPDGSLEWVVPEDELDKEAGASLSGTGSMLFGRRTYEQFEGYWAQFAENASEATSPHPPERRSPEIEAMARWINEAEKVVFSRSLNGVTWRNTSVLRELDPGEIEALKEQPGSDMMLFGSGSIVSQLTEHGLIDEYRFIVTPVLLGDGQPLLRGLPGRTRLELREAKTYPSGTVMLCYAPQSSSGSPSK
jgi:dihydrofolate reductase